ncbi:hypothetical protein AVEN_119589-1 [Araneus ventricosus]|uniref:Uncharacterized protein n=1 Tax=Araneus ventricosus TaxID=182803 RepID=A0A4Y2TQ71_ARAVE|nr:hypothetical protein AVEN_119589-1 [Araneus ventricosus]
MVEKGTSPEIKVKEQLKQREKLFSLASLPTNAILRIPSNTTSAKKQEGRNPVVYSRSHVQSHDGRYPFDAEGSLWLPKNGWAYLRSNNMPCSTPFTGLR